MTVQTQEPSGTYVGYDKTGIIALPPEDLFASRWPRHTVRRILAAVLATHLSQLDAQGSAGSNQAFG